MDLSSPKGANGSWGGTMGAGEGRAWSCPPVRPAGLCSLPVRLWLPREKPLLLFASSSILACQDKPFLRTPPPGLVNRGRPEVSGFRCPLPRASLCGPQGGGSKTVLYFSAAGGDDKFGFYAKDSIIFGNKWQATQ